MLRAMLAAAAACAALAACAGDRGSGGSLTQRLQPCETRGVTVNGVAVVLRANVDGSLGAADVAPQADGAQRVAALNGVAKIFGPVRADHRVVERPGKWGLSVLSDPCGRPATPAPSPPRR